MCYGAGTLYSIGANSFFQKRLEISSGTNDTAMQYLTYVEGTDSGTPLQSEKLTNGNFIAAHIKDPGDDKVVGFSSDASGAVVTLPITYSFTAAASTG